MQTQKENIKQRVLNIAKQEFFEKGFKGASMRVISKKSGVGLSNIYNYYKNKDEILQAVLKPLILCLNDMLDQHNDSENINIEVFTSKEYQSEHINLFVGIILKYKKEFDLLLFKSYGSSLEGFRDEYIDKHTRISLEFMSKMKDKFPHVNVNISKFFIHTMSSWWITIFGEIVSHDLSEKEIKHFVSDYMCFATAGWENIMRI